MTTERAVRILAGTFVLVSLALGVEASPLHHDPRWLWLTAFVGANLLQSGFTRFCPAEPILRKVFGTRDGGDACARPETGGPAVRSSARPGDSGEQGRARG